MGREFRRKGANVQLGPGLNLNRVPMGGRNFEYMTGEDPFLGYTLVKPLIRGIQGQKVWKGTGKGSIELRMKNDKEWNDNDPKKMEMRAKFADSHLLASSSSPITQGRVPVAAAAAARSKL